MKTSRFCRKVDGQITDLRGPAFITSSDETLSGGTGCNVKREVFMAGQPTPPNLPPLEIRV